MREYEVVYIFRSELEDEEVESRLDSHHERLVGDGDGEITAVEDWGKRQLAYPIENEENGRYVVAQFTVEPERLDDFERELKLDGDLLRHLVVLREGELPTPPSARRPGAGPDEETEGEEETESADDGGGDDEPEESETDEEEGDDEEDEEDAAAGEAEEDRDEEREGGEADEEADEDDEEKE